MYFFPQTAQESPTNSPRRRGSPRQTGRGSPGARISWVTAAKSGVGGQVVLNDKGKKGREGLVRSVAGTGQLRKHDRKESLYYEKTCIQALIPKNPTISILFSLSVISIYSQEFRSWESRKSSQLLIDCLDAQTISPIYRCIFLPFCVNFNVFSSTGHGN